MVSRISAINSIRKLPSSLVGLTPLGSTCDGWDPLPSARFAAAPDNKNHALPRNLRSPCSQEIPCCKLVGGGEDIKTNIMENPFEKNEDGNLPLKGIPCSGASVFVLMLGI